jgi:PAS domain S-box-containing protein
MTTEYDIALAKYHSSLQILPLPLLSWDVFNSYFVELNQFNAIQKQWHRKVNFYDVLQSKKEIIVTNMNQEIVYASNGLFLMNGYHANEVIGKTPKLFQGELTCEKARKNIKKALQEKAAFKEVILNYRKDGSTYLCEIEAYPKFNLKGELVNYIAFERIAS